MSIEAEIANALFGKMAGFDFGGLPVAYPEVAFDPAQNPKYIATSILFNQHYFAGVSKGKVIRQGFFQATVYFPKNSPQESGVINVTDAAGDIAAAWSGLVIRGVGVKITVQEPYLTGPISDETRVYVPVNIPWTATAI
jgi:hypothetical protein